MLLIVLSKYKFHAKGQWSLLSDKFKLYFGTVYFPESIKTNKI
jgi:hypothetical protein